MKKSFLLLSLFSVLGVFANNDTKSETSQKGNTLKQNGAVQVCCTRTGVTFEGDSITVTVCAESVTPQAMTTCTRAQILVAKLTKKLQP